jgi:hypothetical protein
MTATAVGGVLMLGAGASSCSTDARRGATPGAVCLGALGFVLLGASMLTIGRIPDPAQTTLLAGALVAILAASAMLGLEMFRTLRS